MNLYQLNSLDDEDQAFLGLKSPANGLAAITSPPRGSVISPVLPTLSLRSLGTTTTAASKPAARMVPRKVRKMQRIATLEEKLDEDFLQTPWRLPSIDIAKDYRFQEVYRGGEGNMSAIHITEASELGVGVRMYFQFLKTMAIGLFLMTLLSIPMILLTSKGNGIALEDQDVFQLYRYSFGNLGNPSIHFDNEFLYSSSSSSSNQSSSSLSHYKQSFSHLNATLATIYGLEITYSEGNFILIFCEILQILIFLIMIIHLKRKLYFFNNQELTKNVVTITSYSIYIENLPTLDDIGATNEEVNEEEIIKHFSTLYPLDKPDWKNRSPVEDARPVQNCENSGDPLYINSWIAEVIIHRKIGNLINQYKENESLLKNLYRIRGKMKMFNINTSHNSGPQMKKFLKAEEEMLQLAEKVDRYNQKNRNLAIVALQKLKEDEKKRKIIEEKKKAKLKAKVKKTKGSNTTKGDNGKKKEETNKVVPVLSSFEADLEEGLTNAQQNKPNDDPLGVNSGGGGKDNSIDTSALTKSDHSEPLIPPLGSPRLTYAKQAPIVGAFVCFEYNESFARCIEDYNKYSSLFYTIFPCYYPEKMKFKGKKLRVSKALEPDQIIYENLEISRIWRSFYRFRTLFLTIIMILICFILIFIAANLRLQYSNEIPTSNMCSSVIPQLYVGKKYHYQENLISQVSFVRPPPLQQASYDSLCSRYIDSSIYAVYSINNDFSIPATNYSFSACIFPPYNDSNTLFTLTSSPSEVPSFAPSYQPTSISTVRRKLSSVSSISLKDSKMIYEEYFNDSIFSYGYCPSYQQPVYCPCLSMSSPTNIQAQQGSIAQSHIDQQSSCSTLSCQLATSTSPLSQEEQQILQDDSSLSSSSIGSSSSCSSFNEQTIGYCYCKQIISDTQTFSQATMNILSKIQFWKKENSEQAIISQSQTQRDSEFCSSFNSLLILSYSVTFASIAVIVLINYLLRYILMALTTSEKHSSLDDEQSSIFVKLFLSKYVNTAFVVLLAYGISISIQSDFSSIVLSPGKYTDFIRSWYGVNGFYFVSTVFITMIQPLTEKYCYYSIYLPIRKWLAYRDLR
jgi:hypothetical protein